MRDSWHNKHRFIMSMKSREPVSEVKLYRNINGEVSDLRTVIMNIIEYIT